MSCFRFEAPNPASSEAAKLEFAKAAKKKAAEEKKAKQAKHVRGGLMQCS